jgi:hypothetical protein
METVTKDTIEKRSLSLSTKGRKKISNEGIRKETPQPILRWSVRDPPHSTFNLLVEVIFETQF